MLMFFRWPQHSASHRPVLPKGFVKLVIDGRPACATHWIVGNPLGMSLLNEWITPWYPMVNKQTTMENCYVSWVSQRIWWPFSIFKNNFHGYVANYLMGYVTQWLCHRLLTQMVIWSACWTCWLLAEQGQLLLNWSWPMWPRPFFVNDTLWWFATMPLNMAI